MIDLHPRKGGGGEKEIRIPKIGRYAKAIQIFAAK